MLLCITRYPTLLTCLKRAVKNKAIELIGEIVVEVLRLYGDGGCKIFYGIGRTMNGNAEEAN